MLYEYSITFIHVDVCFIFPVLVPGCMILVTLEYGSFLLLSWNSLLQTFQILCSYFQEEITEEIVEEVETEDVDQHVLYEDEEEEVEEDEEEVRSWRR